MEERLQKCKLTETRKYILLTQISSYVIFIIVLYFIILFTIIQMHREMIKDKCFAILILFAFCLSSATLGGFLLYGDEIHLNHHNAHVHHTNEDHDLGETEHKDASTILYLDYVVLNSSNSVKTLPALNAYLSSCHLPDYCYNSFNSFSSTTHFSNLNRSCTHDLYQLNSSYLI